MMQLSWHGVVMKAPALQHEVTKTLAWQLHLPVWQPNQGLFAGGLRHANDHGQAYSGGSR